ncbi:MAG: hypothetical protein AAF570_00070 [Bacteroidota bacterium]
MNHRYLPLFILLFLTTPLLGQDIEPLQWFRHQYPIPEIGDFSVQNVKLVDYAEWNKTDRLTRSQKRQFVLQKPTPPEVTMEFNLDGQLILAIQYGLESLLLKESHLRQTYDENGRLICKENFDVGFQPGLLMAIDSFLYAYDKKGQLATLTMPHRNLGAQDTSRRGIRKQTHFTYDRKGQVIRLLKMCDPDDDRASGLLIECARDTFYLDHTGKPVRLDVHDGIQLYTDRTFRYDRAGRLWETTVYEGANPATVIAWEYDRQGRPTARFVEDAQGITPSIIHRFYYRPDGLLDRYSRQSGEAAPHIDLKYVYEFDERADSR